MTRAPHAKLRKQAAVMRVESALTAYAESRKLWAAISPAQLAAALPPVSCSAKLLERSGGKAKVQEATIPAAVN